jgi:hypothetical protein
MIAATRSLEIVSRTESPFIGTQPLEVSAGIRQADWRAQLINLAED